MTNLEIAKRVVSFTVGFGTSAIVTSAIKNNTAPGNAIDQVAMPVATIALGWMISEKTRQWTDAKCDEVIAWVSKKSSS